MIIFEDVFSGDELASDAYDVKEIGEIAYEVNGKLIIVKEGADVDIGANPSAEETEETLEEGTKQIIDVVHSFRLEPTTFDKKAYLTYIKGYMKRLKEHLSTSNPDRVPVFEKEAQTFVKKILDNFKDYEFYVGPKHYDGTEGMVVLLNYREDGITPYFTLFRDGLKGTKV